MAVPSISFVLLSSRPWYDPAVADEPDDHVLVLAVGPPFSYVIPSFDVLKVEMRQMKVKVAGEGGDEEIYDVFIRDDPSLCLTYPVEMVVKDSTVIQEEEFSIRVNTAGMKFVPEGVIVIWDWAWLEEDSDGDISASEYQSQDYSNPHLQSDDTESSAEAEEETGIIPSSPQLHTVTFKCIGTTHDANAQQVLMQVSQQLERGEVVPIMIAPEPDNQYDAKAIAFKCQVAEEWHRIGYVVKEALDHVHIALTQDQIADVSFAWVKYLVVWSRSGPGYYAGINITINGTWPLEVCRCASTR